MSDRKLIGFITASALAMLALLFSACHVNLYATTYATLTLAEKVDRAALDQFPALDKYKRAQIVQAAKSEEEGKAALAEWDIKVEKIVKAINGTDAAVKLARDAMVDIKAGKRSEAELSTWIASAVNLGVDLKNLLESAGVPLKVSL